jgi:hypothetical protein
MQVNEISGIRKLYISRSLLILYKRKDDTYMLHPRFALGGVIVLPLIVALSTQEPIAPVITLLVSVAIFIFYGKYYDKNKP